MVADKLAVARAEFSPNEAGGHGILAGDKVTSCNNASEVDTSQVGECRAVSGEAGYNF